MNTEKGTEIWTNLHEAKEVIEIRAGLDIESKYDSKMLGDRTSDGKTSLGTIHWSANSTLSVATQSGVDMSGFGGSLKGYFALVKRHHIVNLTTGWRRLVPGRMQGSSIIEALVSMIIVAIVFAGAVTAFTDAFRSDRTTIRLGAFEAAMQTMDSIAEYDCRPEWVDHTGYSVGISYDSSSIPGIVLVEVEALGADQAKLFSMKRYMSGK